MPEACCFLLPDGSLRTGQQLVVDGGLSLWALPWPIPSPKVTERVGAQGFCDDGSIFIGEHGLLLEIVFTRFLKFGVHLSRLLSGKIGGRGNIRHGRRLEVDFQVSDDGLELSRIIEVTRGY